MGKWDKIIDTLSPLPVEDEKYQDQINKIKQSITEGETHTPESLVQNYREARFGQVDFTDLEDSFKREMIALLGVEGLDALQKEAQKKVTALEQLLQESNDMDEPGWGEYGASPSTIKLRDGGSLSVQWEPTGKVVDKEKFRLWCIANGLEKSLQLWPSTMNSMVKEKLEAGEPTPDGVEAHSRYKIVYRKG